VLTEDSGWMWLLPQYGFLAVRASLNEMKSLHSESVSYQEKFSRS
jgi:hypothetical protein